MPLEIEAKLKVDSHDVVRGILRRRCAERLSAVIETNRIYDAPDGRLRNADIGLRIRTIRDESSAALSATLTIKGPPGAGPFKAREEIEIDVEKADEADRALRILGFEPALVYRKRRESFRMERCRVELDLLPHLGAFVEIEGPDADTVRRVQEALELGDVPHIPQSYVALLHAHCASHGLDPLTLDFPPA